MAQNQLRAGQYAATFKQMGQGYRLANSLREVIDHAVDTLECVGGTNAAKYLSRYMERVEANPLAKALIERHQTGSLTYATDLLAEAKRVAAYEVNTTYTGEWRQGVGLESKIELGESLAGHHYRIQWSTPSNDSDGIWSKAMPDKQSALRAAIAEDDRAHGETPMRHPMRHDVVPQETHTNALAEAARQRVLAVSAKHWYGSNDAKPHVQAAKEALGYARETREAASSIWGVREAVGHVVRQSEAPRQAQQQSQGQGMAQ